MGGLLRTSRIDPRGEDYAQDTLILTHGAVVDIESADYVDGYKLRCTTRLLGDMEPKNFPTEPVNTTMNRETIRF